MYRVDSNIAIDVRACFVPWKKLPQTDELKMVL